MTDPGEAKRAVLASLLPAFLENRRKDVTRIRDAIAARDFETIARITHNLRGNGASYGFPELSALGQTLEVAANVQDAEALTEGATRLDRLLDVIATRE